MATPTAKEVKARWKSEKEEDEKTRLQDIENLKTFIDGLLRDSKEGKPIKGTVPSTYLSHPVTDEDVFRIISHYDSLGWDLFINREERYISLEVKMK